jgi:hypothetical protein
VIKEMAMESCARWRLLVEVCAAFGFDGSWSHPRKAHSVSVALSTLANGK